MRIGMLCDMYHPHTSGVTNHISLVKAALEAAGHDVFVLTFGDREHADAEPNVLRSPGVPWGDTGYNAGYWYAAEARAVARSLDVAHVHHPFQSGRMALRYCAPLGIPVVFTAHTRYDLYAQVYAPFLPSTVSVGWVASQLRSFCTRTGLVVAPSSVIRDVLRGFGVTAPIDVVRNGIALAPFRAAPPAERASLGLAAEDVVLAYVGRLGAEKDVTTLVEAFAAAHARQPRLALVLIGDGPERERLRDRVDRLGVTGRVHLLGARPYAEVPSILRACDGFVTASVSEVDPLTVMEALAAGLPVVATDSPPLRETVVAERSGLLATPGVAPLTEALVRFAADATLRRTLALGAGRDAEGFSVERTAAALLERYERIGRRDAVS